MENIKHIIESLLFVADEPLTLDRIKKILMESEAGEIRDAIAELTAEYDARPGGFYLDEVAGGYQIRTRPEYNEWIKKLIQPKPLRLSKPALETLVIIAYKQPIIRSDIEHLRGVDCGGVLHVLLERKLIRVLGRREIPGRPLIYATTKRFLETFDLKNLRDLPTPKEIGELAASADEGHPAVLVDSTQESEDYPEDYENPETTEEDVQEFQASPIQSADIEITGDTPALAEDQSVEDQPTEDHPAEVQPEEVRPEEDQPEEVQPAEDQPEEDQPAEDQPAEDQPAEDQPAEDHPAEDQPEEDHPAEDQPEEDHPAEDQPEEGHPAEDQPEEDHPEKPEENT